MTEPALAAAVDLGGTKIYSVIATEQGEVLGDDLRPTLAQEGPDAVVDRIVASVREAAQRSGVEWERVRGIGISSPGPVNPGEGIVTDAPNLPGFHDFPIARLLSEALGKPALLENDANAAAYGELRFGAGRGFRHIVYVTLGTGIGGGLIIDGRIYEGASGAAGEVGHLIVDPDGAECNCGNRGCVEALASGRAIEREAAEAVAAGRSEALARAAAGGKLTGEAVHAAAMAGDAAAREIIARAGYYLGLGLAGLLNCFNPEALILGGGLVAMGELYLGPAVETAKAGAFPQIVADVTITEAALGRQAGALGAAALVVEHNR